MVCQVHYGVLVRFRGKGELEGVVLSPLVMRNGLEISGISLLSVLGEIHELYGAVNNAAVPDLYGKSLGAAVQLVRAIVDGQVILLAVQFETALCNPVGEPSGNPSYEGSVIEVLFRGVKAKGNVNQFPVLVRYQY